MRRLIYGFIGPFTFCFNLSFYSHSQTIPDNGDKFLPGQIVTLKNDTVSGFILVRDHPFNANNCVFKASSDARPVTYSPRDIVAYSISDRKYFFAHTIGQDAPKSVFLECIVKGKVSLFFYQDRMFLRTAEKVEELITQKGSVEKGGKVFTVDLPLYKALLQKEMNDCPTIHKNLQSTTFEKKSLKQLFLDYNTCISSDATAYEGDMHRLHARFGFSLAAYSSTLNIASGGNPSYTYLDTQEGARDVSLSPSIWVEFVPLAPRIRFRTGLTFYSSQYRTYDENRGSGLSHELIIHQSRFEIPVQMRFNLLKGATGLYIIGQIGLNWSSSWDNKQTVRVLPSYVLSETSDLENSKFFANPMAGIGLTFPLGNHALLLEGYYGWAPLVFKPASNSPQAVITALSFGAGFMF